MAYNGAIKYVDVPLDRRPLTPHQHDELEDLVFIYTHEGYCVLITPLMRMQPICSIEFVHSGVSCFVENENNA